MSNSFYLGLPYLAASQAQKHVTVNEALSVLDSTLHLSVISRVLATPPASPSDGDRYLIATGPTGLWAGHAGHVALRLEGAWRFLVPRSGWRIWIEAEVALLVFNGTTWMAPPVPNIMQNLALLGVNATADTTNKMSVSSSAVLFNHVGAGIQFKINKNAATDTASLLLQTGFSGRAEIGTSGDDDLHFKVSADGSSFNESLIVSAASGKVTLKNTAVLDPQAGDPSTPSNGQIWYDSTTGKFRARQNGASVDLIATAGGVADGDKGDVTVSSSGAVWTIDPSTITNTKLSNISSGQFKARASVGAGNVEDITGTQATALLDVFTSTLKGLAPSSAGGTTNYLRADGTWAAPPTGGVIDGDKGDISITGSGSVWTIDAATITNTKLADMPAQTFKANAALIAGPPQDLTPDQMRSALNLPGLLYARSLILA